MCGLVNILRNRVMWYWNELESMHTYVTCEKSALQLGWEALCLYGTLWIGFDRLFLTVGINKTTAVRVNWQGFVCLFANPNLAGKGPQK